MPTRLSASQVIRVIEKLEGRRLARSLLDYYEKTQLVVPSVRPGSGRGGGSKTRYYSVADVVMLRWLVQLTSSGAPLQRVRRAFDYLRRHLPDRLESRHALRFLWDGSRIILTERNPKKVLRDISGARGQLLFNFDQENLSEDLERAVRSVLAAA
jgi:DNA-binding transcriptional MerR regulator